MQILRNTIFQNPCMDGTLCKAKLITTEKLTNSLSVAPNHQFVDEPRAVASSTKTVWISSFFTSAKCPPNSSQYSTDSSQVFGSMSIAKKKHPCGEVIQPSGQLYFKLDVNISKMINIVPDKAKFRFHIDAKKTVFRSRGVLNELSATK